MMSWSNCEEEDDPYCSSNNEEVAHPHNDEGGCMRMCAPAPPEITRNETRLVFWAKVVLLCILCSCTVGVAVSVFFYTTKSEQEEFENRFQDSAQKVLQTIGLSLYLSLGALDAFAVGTVACASTLNATSSPWPFVTLPNFAVRAAKLKSIAKAFTIVQYNYVPAELKQQWEAYSLANDDWVPQSMEVQANDPNFDGLLLDTWEPQPNMYNNWEGTSTSPGPFMASWQHYPVVPTYPAYNWDVMSFLPFQKAWPAVQKGQVVLRCSNIPDPIDADAVTEARYTNHWASPYLPPDADPAEPQIEVYYPLTVEAKDSVVQSPPSSSSKVVGVLAPSIFWRDIITQILPEGSGTVHAVFKFGKSVFTYAIDGPEVTFLGQGDLHSPRFDALEQSGHLLDLTTPSTATYTGLPLSEDMRDYTIHIYPSAQMEDEFSTNNPAHITTLTVLIFCCTSAVFLMYDRCVERRQRKVLHTAVQSRENVLLLEHLVQERTQKLEASNMQLEEANKRVVQASELQLQHFACMSHEIRTPLNCIIGLSSLMEESEELNPLQRDSMRMIVSSGDLLRAVVDDVLDYSKLESGNVDVDIKRSNLQQSLGSVVHSVEMRGLSTDVSIKTSYDCLVPEIVTTDSRRVQQILYNLLGNAVKFSPNGGTVEFSISITEPGFAPGAYSPPFSLKGDGESKSVVIDSEKVLRFTVKDYGKGIAAEDYPKIFKPFIQMGELADNESIYGGTGLGLPITVKLTHAFGGSLSVESAKGKWTKFTVDLPFLDDVVDTSTAAAGLRDVMVLLIANDPLKRATILGNLQRFHLKCQGFESMTDLQAQLQVLDYLASERYVIVLAQEDLFVDSTFEMLSNRAPSVLLTYGPKFLVGKASGHHRSLTKMLPSALISSMLASLEPLEKKKAPEKRSSKNSTACCSLRFLVAEDNLVNQKVLRNILGRLGVHNIEVVDNGRKAVDREAAEPFDVVLMDMQMPVMGGVDACRLINERRGGHPRAKVVFVTAHVQENFREECRQAGAVGYLAKPCTLRGVEECLQDLLAGM